MSQKYAFCENFFNCTVYFSIGIVIPAIIFLVLHYKAQKQLGKYEYDKKKLLRVNNI